MIDKDRDKIEDIKYSLYDIKNKDINHHLSGVLHEVTHKVDKEWNKEELEKEMKEIKEKKPRTPILKKFFVLSFVFFLVAALYSLYMFFGQNTLVSNEKININILGNAFVSGGEELNLLVEIANKNNVDLSAVNLIVEYPNGAGENISDVTRLPNQEIGIIKSGETINKNVKVRLYGEENSIRNIKFGIEYKSEGSNSIFTKESLYPVTISKAPISLTINAPREAVLNQEISFGVNTILNTSSVEENTILQLSYPSGFEFIEAVPSPDFGNSVWNLSTIDKTKPFNVIVRGKLSGEDKENKVIYAYAGLGQSSDKSKVSVIYNSLLHNISVTRPFLEAQIIADDSVSGGENVNVKIVWSNNTPSKINDAVIIAEVTGDGFLDKSIISKEGFYDSYNNKIVWDKNTIPFLSEIGAGASGSFSFSFRTKTFVGLSGGKNNPQASISVSIRGRQASSGSFFQNVDNFSNKIIKILSEFQIVASSEYLSGSLPLKAENETKYLVRLSLSNTINGVSGAKAVTKLPIYVEWDGLSSSTGESLKYNEYTREVIWDIGYVNAGVGVDSNREVSFIISLRPSLSQVKTSPKILEETNLSGLDTHTNITVNNTYRSINTSDAYYRSGGDGSVTQ